MRKGKPSRTAVVVAKSQALIAADGLADAPVAPEAAAFARHALRQTGHTAFVKALRFPRFRRALHRLESCLIPGLALHHVRRKQWIEAQVQQALGSGIRQVIQMGAGLDSLCYRLHRKWPEVAFFEFDHPATQLVKRALLENLPSGSNLSLHPLDLRSRTFPAPPASFHPGEPTFLIAEGVLMYLPEHRATACLHDWARRFAPESLLLTSILQAGGFKSQSPAVNWWLRRTGEPFLWTPSSSRTEAVLAGTGWNQVRSMSESEGGPPSTRKAEGEKVLLARCEKCFPAISPAFSQVDRDFRTQRPQAI